MRERTSQGRTSRTKSTRKADRTDDCGENGTGCGNGKAHRPRSAHAISIPLSIAQRLDELDSEEVERLQQLAVDPRKPKSSLTPKDLPRRVKRRKN